MSRAKPKPDKYEPQIKSIEMRAGDQMVEVTLMSRTAIIDYADIFKAAVTGQDEASRTPWEDCDGWEHAFVPYDRLKFEQQEHWQHMANKVRRTSSTDRGIIVVDTDTVKKRWGCGGPSGCSKQTDAEAVAAVRKRTIAQLVKWYEKGWWIFYVSCEFLDEHESVGGIFLDDYDEDDPVIVEYRHEMAGQVAHALEKRGYTVTNQPPPYDRRKVARNNLKHRLAHNMGFETYEEYRKWVTARKCVSP